MDICWCYQTVLSLRASWYTASQSGLLHSRPESSAKSNYNRQPPKKPQKTRNENKKVISPPLSFMEDFPKSCYFAEPISSSDSSWSPSLLLASLEEVLQIAQNDLTQIQSVFSPTAICILNGINIMHILLNVTLCSVLMLNVLMIWFNMMQYGTVFSMCLTKWSISYCNWKQTLFSMHHWLATFKCTQLFEGQGNQMFFFWYFSV